MALVKTEQITQSFTGMSRLPLLRQFGLLVGLAASIALGIGIVTWSQTPGYSLLYGSLTERDAAQVVEALQRSGIDYRLDDRTGGVMVPGGRLHEARMQLAGEGLPKGTGLGYEMLQEEPSLGTSRFLESARYQHALEVELGRTIGTLANVRSARVHLAIPQPSVFVRERNRPRASVLINLQPGRSLEKGQVEAVVHMVSSSVPELAAADVKVIDHKGRLLTSPGDDRDIALTAQQFEITRGIEQAYVRRIERILGPAVGIDGLRAEVAADLDFTMTERTQESFNPEQSVVRSEQTLEEQSQGLAGAAGIPGALSNQPPAAAAAPETPAAAQGPGVSGQPLNSTRRVTRNYELEKTISHTRQSPGVLRRLSVAVLIDDRAVAAEDGTVTRTPRDPEEIERLAALVREAVGFNEERGDRVNVTNVSFAPPPEIEPAPEASLLEQDWVWSAARQVGGVALLLVVAFGVLRPMLRSLAEKGRAVPVLPTAAGAGAAYGAVAGQEGAGAVPQLRGPADNYVQAMQAAQSMVKDDPKRVAQVVKSWVAGE